MTAPALRAPFELDHVFVCCAEGAPEAEALRGLGLEEGIPNTHPGQGTACRRFFFANAYLELLWVSDAREAQGPSVQRTRLWERWSGRAQGACPFAVILRPDPLAEKGAPPFATWSYRPGYLPPGWSIEVAEETPLSEPALFYLPFAARPGQPPAAHALPPYEITGVAFTLPGGDPPSPAARSLEAAGMLSFSARGPHRMDITFDRGRQGRKADLRPRLPLVLSW